MNITINFVNENKHNRSDKCKETGFQPVRLFDGLFHTRYDNKTDYNNAVSKDELWYSEPFIRDRKLVRAKPFLCEG